MKNENTSINVDKIVKDMERKEISIQDKKFNYIQLIIFIGSILEIIACFLPMFSAEAFGISASVNYIKGDGIFAIILLVGTCALTYFNKYKFALGLSAINMVLLIIDCFFSANEFVHLAFGGYILLIAGIIVIIGTGMNYTNHKKD